MAAPRGDTTTMSAEDTAAAADAPGTDITGCLTSITLTK